MLEEIILREIESTEEEVSVVLKSLSKNQWIFKHNEEKVLPSASTIKILIMVEAFRRIELGEHRIDEKIKVAERDKVDFSIITELDKDEYKLIDLIIWMIIISDNTATNVLIDLLGYEEINKMAELLNCKNTVLQRKMMDFEAVKLGKENLTTALDMALIMEAIYNKTILSEKSCNMMIDILKRQRHRDKLPRYIVDDVALANKTGELDGINHDIGIFYLRNLDYLIGVFTTDGKDDISGKKTIGRISETVYKYFTR
ncbi:MAG: serine hydrolase [Tissierellia bacterium]|nr:serine hydrolase [Tissierellia bacterium]